MQEIARRTQYKLRVCRILSIYILDNYTNYLLPINYKPKLMNKMQSFMQL
jgi:hypothetical protein